jgi:Protein of unknown function (DUF4236)
MGFRFQRRKKLAQGVALNIGKRGGSLSFGRRGAKVNVGRRGMTGTATLLGTGFSYVKRLGRK